MNSEILSDLLADQTTLSILRILTAYPKGVVAETIAQEVPLPVEQITELLEQIEEKGGAAHTHLSNQRLWTLGKALLHSPALISAIERYEQQLVKERAHRQQLSAVSRLQWIEDAFQMIQHARRTMT